MESNYEIKTHMEESGYSCRQNNAKEKRENEINKESETNQTDNLNFFEFEMKHRQYLGEKYTNTNFKIDTFVPSFILFVSSMILCLETLFNTIKPLIKSNQIFKRIFELLFKWYLIIEEITFGITNFFSTSINDDSKNLLSDKLTELKTKFSNIFSELGNIIYDTNKTRINTIINDINKEIAEKKND
jgi:hypothetical protein